MNYNDKRLWSVVKENDKRLFDLASYYESKGFTVSSKDLTEKIMGRFAEFKARILRGSLTLEQLETDVLKKFGVTEGSQYISAPVETLPKDIKKMIDELSGEVEDKEYYG